MFNKRVIAWISPLITHNNVILGICTVFQAPRDAYDFILKPGFLRVAYCSTSVWSEGELSPLCQWGFLPVLMGLYAAWEMFPSLSYILL